MAPVGFPAIAWIPPYVAQVPTATMAVALGASRSSHSLVVIGCPVAGSLPNPHQYPSSWSCSFGIDPSTTSTNGSSSPRSALKNHSRKSSAPPFGPHSKSIRGQCTAIFGSPGSAPSAISSMLGCVAAVSATESPSQLRPALIHRTWIKVSSALTAASVGICHSFLDPGWGSQSPHRTLASGTTNAGSGFTPVRLSCQRIVGTCQRLPKRLPAKRSSRTTPEHPRLLSQTTAKY